ncbi:MAG: tryptophan synthase subunit alpha [Desulfobacterales bacterium]
MNRIDATFDRMKQKNESALVGFVTAGDPKPDASLQILDAMCRAGVDVLELGIPFSDPTADGPVIQRSSARALKGGMSLQRAFEVTRRLRTRFSLPIVLFSYYNPILQYGTAAFYRSATEAGADGVLVVDLPPEESAEFTDHRVDTDLHLIRLIAPTTPPVRMRRIAAAGSGFLYLVSKTGVTGSDGLNTVDITQKMADLRAVTSLPICVGFGISTAADVAAIAAIADGVVIGSAFERTIENNIDRPDLADRIAAQVREYKAATSR